MAGISSTGLGSGLDVRGLVDGLVAAERQPQIIQLDRKESNLQAKLSSFGIFKSALSEFRTSLAGLRQSSQFGVLKATSSDSEVVNATVDSNADTGKFNIESKQLAQAHSLVTGGFVDASATVGTGTLTIKFGATDYDATTDTYNGFTQNPDRGTLAVNIDASNNTLTGLRDAINDADAGVNASIIFDGSAYRMVLTAKDTGAENSLQISVDDASLSQFEFNSTATNLDQTQVAQDAIMSINGLDVTNASNSFTDTLKGVTLNLGQVQPGKIISLEIGKSTEEVASALEGFVGKYNELIGSVKELTSYNAEEQKGSVLIGDITVRSGMTQIRSVLSSIVSGLENTSVRTLIDLGISTQADGTLAFDSSKLNKALNDDPEGVAAVFTVLGRSDNEGVTYFSSEDTTQTGKYTVNVTQAATQGVLNGTAIAAFPLTISGSETFKVRVDGNLSDAIVLTAGVYNSGTELAAEIQSRINGDASLKSAGAKAQVDFDGANNRMVITSQVYGADSTVEITESTASALGLNVASGTVGTNVAGTIGGVQAEGNGQYLTAPSGLKLFVKGGLSGSLGSISFSRGLMEKLDDILGGLLDSDGSLKAKTDGLQKTLDLIGEERINLDKKTSKLEQRLLSKFNAMDAILGQFQSTGSFLSQQLDSLPFNNSSKKK
jgi:flagellar hook-associated protein 2